MAGLVTSVILLQGHPDLSVVLRDAEICGSVAGGWLRWLVELWMTTVPPCVI